MLIDLEDFFKYTKLDIKRKSKVLLSFKETEKGTPKKGNERYSISPLDPILITPLYMQFCLGRIMHNAAFCPNFVQSSFIQQRRVDIFLYPDKTWKCALSSPDRTAYREGQSRLDRGD